MDNNQRPIYALYAAVTPTFRGEFFNRENEVTRKGLELLKNPGHLRYLGWNMDTLDVPKVVQGGKAWEVRNGDSKTIRLYPDGSVLALAGLDSEFLGWGQKESQFLQNPIVNNLALVEYSFEFVNFVSQLYRLYDYETGGVEFMAAMQNTQLSNGKKLKISHYAADMRTGFAMTRNLKEVVGDFDDVTIRFDIPTLKSAPQKVAFELLEKVFLKFDIIPNDIPFTRDEMIDIEQIKKIQ